MYIYLLYYLILNNTFGCYLALFITFIIFLITALIKKEKRVLIALSIIAFIITSFFAKTTEKNIASDNLATFSKDIHNIVSTAPTSADFEKAGTGRMLLWIYGLKFFSQRPIIGYGPENLGAKFAEAKINQDRPHNILIQLATTSGLPGLILYCTAIGIILFNGFKKLDMKNELHITFLFVAISYIISSMFGNSMYYTTPYFFIILGFLFRETLKFDQEKKL